ncbi:alpha/beta hydrolase [Tateyamaria pelophila]|uniref:alpha/beta hydrolase n=1 Tax=Tateyamaria pelophila TaxID=328415 RepID=UPI001CBAD4C2|nr:alpha/beta fold hydrolase [Tateyamaria pelophila]
MKVRAIIAIAMTMISLWVLETARHTVSISQFDVGQTPVTEYSTPDGNGPTVVIAHGFAGSQQMMQGYALPLARTGYRVFAFDYLGHGRNPTPMSGDVTVLDGTTRLLMAQTNSVIDAVETDQPVALIGHSMATDILVRVAAERDDIGPIVLISAFSKAIDATTPTNLLLISGAWEAGLRGFAREAVQMVAPADAEEGETVKAGNVSRRAVAAPFSEHVSVLQSRVGRAEAVNWLDVAYGRSSDVRIWPTGWAILGLLFGLVFLFRSIARYLPVCTLPDTTLSRKRLAIALILPMVIAPLVAVPLNVGILPVLVADYLVLHLFVFGAIQLVLLRLWRIPFGPMSWPAFGLLVIWSALFGFALDRYAANFWPTPERLWIIVAMIAGALPYMLADTTLTATAGLLRRIAVRGSFLVSLGFAVSLDFEGLFFLIMIAPVLVLFYLVFGTMGHAAAQRSGPLAAGLALGLVLAWALGVSFPVFQA